MGCRDCDRNLASNLLPIVDRFETAAMRREICRKCKHSESGPCELTGADIKSQSKRLSVPCPIGKYDVAKGMCSSCGRSNQYLTDYGDCKWCENYRRLAKINRRAARRTGVASGGKPVSLRDWSESSWSVAITTAPRKEITIQRCVDSVAACGWEPVIFAEPGSTATSHKTIVNDHRLGVWHNWMQSARWAIEQGADFVLTAQDDALFHPHSRQLIESIRWPRDAAFVSLYTPKHYSLSGGRSIKNGIRQIRTSSLWGALAMVWRPSVLAAVIDHPIAKSWLGVRGAKEPHRSRRRADPSLIANSDTAIGRIANDMKLGMYFVDPSAVDHIARFSTIGHGGNKGRRNAIRIADHSRPLIDQVYGVATEPSAPVDR